MSRATKVMGFSVPKELAEEYEEMAKEERKTKSELFREMVRKYRQSKELEEFKELRTYGAEKAKELGIKSEKDILRLIHEARGV